MPASYSYNNDGLLSSITNARGNQTEDPLGRTTSVGYDSNGNVTSRTDGNGSTTVYSYDDIDRVTRRTFGDQSAVDSNDKKYPARFFKVVIQKDF